MSKQREALKAVLAICEDVEMRSHSLWDRTADPDAQGRAIAASDIAGEVRAMLQSVCEPEQEPVGIVRTVGGYPDDSTHTVEWLVKHKELRDGDKLYASPQTRNSEPEQEPVAWMYHGILHTGTPHDRPSLILRPEYMDALSASMGAKATPLYTAPPQRKPLTDEEIDNLELPPNGCTMRELVRVVERAHGIGDE